MDVNAEKRQAGDKAAEYVQSGMTIGIGTGSTVYWLIQALARRIAQENLGFRAVATSEKTVHLIRGLGFDVVSLDQVKHLDVAIDGADEVDPRGRLIKGGGGALVRERLVARAAERFIVMVDESKQVQVLGKFPLPIEIVPFGWQTTCDRIRDLGVDPVLRLEGQEAFVSDNGNYIVDAKFEAIPDPNRLYRSVKLLAGVVDVGIFAEFKPLIIIAKNGEVKEQQW